MNARYRTFATSAILASALAWPARARAQSAEHKAAAEALFEEGRKLMAEGKVAQACPKFADSEQLDASSSTLLNLANCYEKQGRTASAWVTYKEAASLASANGRADHLGVAQKRAEALTAKLSRVTVNVTAPLDGLEIKRDGVAVTRAEWGLAIPVDPGTHAYEATAPGHTPWSSNVEVAPDGASASVTIPSLETVAAAAASTPEPRPAQEIAPTPRAPEPSPAPLGGQRIAGIALAGLGVVGLGLGTAFTVAAKSQYDTSLTYCRADNHDVCSDTGIAKRNDARTAGDIATVSFAVGAVALAGGAALWILAPRASAEARENTRTANTRTTMVLLPTLGGAMLRGQW